MGYRDAVPEWRTYSEIDEALQDDRRRGELMSFFRNIFGGGGTGLPPPPSPAAPPPPPPTAATPSVQAAGAQAQTAMAAAAGLGQEGTILTSGQGAAAPQTAQKTLTGT